MLLEKISQYCKTAAVLGIPHHKVYTRVKRLGGGFGGKKNHCLYISSPAAIAAKKFIKLNLNLN